MTATATASRHRAEIGLTIGDVHLVAVEVPMSFPLGTSAAVVRKAPLLLIDLETRDGVGGRTYLFGYRRSELRAMAAVIEDIAELIKGERVLPLDNVRALARRFDLIGVTGMVRMALSALDAALWDAMSVAAGISLAALLGSTRRKVPAYNSSGLGLMSPGAAADEAEKLLAGGFKALKLRLGHPTLAGDIAVTRAVRTRVPNEIDIMVDYNQALTVAEALRRGHALEDEGVYWLEEPTRHSDYAGNAQIASELRLPLQLGENFNGPQDMARALVERACDYVMPDLARIGGASGWLQASALAATAGVEMSSHLYPEFSVHLLAATPTAHWLEYVDWANPILEEPLVIENGSAIVPNRPGAGLAWNRTAIERLRLD